MNNGEDSKKSGYKLCLVKNDIQELRLRLILRFIPNHDIEITWNQQKEVLFRNSSSDGDDLESKKSLSVEDFSSKNSSDLNDSLCLSSNKSLMDISIPFDLKSSKHVNSPNHMKIIMSPRKPNAKRRIVSYNRGSTLGTKIHYIPNQSHLVLGNGGVITNIQDIVQELIYHFKPTNSLGFWNNNKKLSAWITVILTTIDPCIKRVLSFIDQHSVGDITSDEGVIRVHSKKKLTDFNYFIQDMYEHLEKIEKKINVSRGYIIEEGFSLADIYLFSALNRSFQLMFDDKVRKFWLPKLTIWFQECLKRQEIIDEFGEIHLCKQSCLLKMEKISNKKIETNSSTNIPVEVDLEFLRSTLKTCIDKDTLENQSEYTDSVNDLAKLIFPNDKFHCWKFDFIKNDESPNSRDYFSRKVNTVDDLTTFMNIIQQKVSEFKGSDEIIVYTQVQSTCEELKAFFSFGQNTLIECSQHNGRYFIDKQCQGFLVSTKKDLHDFFKKLDETDIIIIKPVLGENIVKTITDILIRETQDQSHLSVLTRYFK